MSFGPSQPIGSRLDDVSVVGGGWSFSEFDHSRLPGFVIAVNDAAFHLQRRPDMVVSMDRLWTEYRWDWLCDNRLQAWIRRSALKNCSLPEDWTSWLRIFDCDYKTCIPTSKPGRLNGTNSGACAINLAWRMQPHRLWLFGFDMGRSPSKQPYWYPPYPWNPKGGTKEGKYREWSNDMLPLFSALFRAGIETTLIGNKESRLDGTGLRRMEDLP